MKHTKGPWEVEDDYDDIYVVGERYVCRIEEWSITAAGGQYDDINAKLKEEREANAHLIAAAPELLKAVIQALEIFDGEWPVDDEVMGPVMKEYKLLIDKAKGIK